MPLNVFSEDLGGQPRSIVMSSNFLLELDDPWGLLVGEEEEGEEEGDFVPLVGEQFSIGRGKSN